MSRRRYKTVYGMLSNRKRWTKRAYARLANSEVCCSNDPKAVRWCLIGACMEVYGCRADEEVIDKLRRVLGRDLVWSDLSKLNDSATHSEILEVVKKAGL